MDPKVYSVYIMASISGVLYIGITNNLTRRVWEHKQGLADGFSKKYRVKKLVYYECTHDITSALEREKQLKRWRCEKKTALVEMMNPSWNDLYREIL